MSAQGRGFLTEKINFNAMLDLEMTAKDIQQLLIAQVDRINKSIGDTYDSFKALKMMLVTELSKRSVEELDLPIGAYKLFFEMDIKSLVDLVRKTELELLQCPDFGVYTLELIKEELAKRNLRLEMEI